MFKEFSGRFLSSLRQAKTLYPEANVFSRFTSDPCGLYLYHYDPHVGLSIDGRIECDIEDMDFMPDIYWKIDEVLKGGTQYRVWS